MVLEHMLEFYYIRMIQGFVDFDFGYQLNESLGTFCLALERLSEDLAMILAADIFFVSRLVT